jgi:hypothetical protein
MKFFRTIRFDLVGQKQTAKYLRYAVGEIVLVVVGILIALQINNWNESRRQATREEQFLVGVRGDLRRDRDYIEVVLENMEPRLDAYDRQSQEPLDLYNADREALVALFQAYFVSQRTFYPVSGSFQSAISGNEVNNYESKDITRAIINLYNSTYVRLEDNAEYLDDKQDFLSRKYSHERRTGQLSEFTPEQISELLDDMYYHYLQLKWYAGLLRDATAEIDAILHEN